MPIDVPSRELEAGILDWLFNSGPIVQTIHGILIDGSTADITNLIQRPNLSLADVVAFELPEATAAAYTRTSLKAPAPLPIVFDSVSDQRSEIDRVIFATTITPGQTWPYLGMGVVARSRPWANRLLTATDVNADWVQFQTRGVTFVSGERVIFTAEAGGVLPGGLSANTVYQTNIVATDANVTHFNLRALGSTTNINITTAHTGNVRIRSVDGFLAKLTIEGTGSIGNPVLQRQQASGTFQFGLEGGIQAIA